jgi:hypothetical protein
MVSAWILLVVAQKQGWLLVTHPSRIFPWSLILPIARRYVMIVTSERMMPHDSIIAPIQTHPTGWTSFQRGEWLVR